jgi:hypothetical protein
MLQMYLLPVLVVLEPMMYDPVKPKTHANAETFLRFAAVI